VLTASEFWDREATAPVAPPAHSWTANPAVRHYINRAVGGFEGSWPLDWFQSQYPGRVFERVLSVGCGTGALERDLLLRGITRQIDAFDGSAASIEIARRESPAVNYFVGDFNTIALPRGRYDMVCFHQSLHHVAALERLLRHVRHSLRPGGLLYLDEFVGPSRTDWNEYQVRWYRALYHCFPRNVRYFDEAAMPIQHDDPSEAIRSSEILSRLVIGFRVVHFRGYGGNIMAVLFPNLHVERLTGEQVDTMIRSEQALIAAGDPHFHAVIVAEPKPGAFPTFRYVVEDAFPKSTKRLRAMIRVMREV
jgi:SAM-dependent methyltransferase